MSGCTCSKDPQITCAIHPTQVSLHKRIAELEAELERMRKIDTTKIDRNKLFTELKEQEDEHQQSVSD